MPRGSLTWLRRAAFAATAVLIVITPGPAASSQPQKCAGLRCQSAGTVRWTRPLPGAWLARPGLAGTEPADGAGYVAVDSQVAAVGVGMTVRAYRAASGQPMWSSTLSGFPAGSAIVSVRAWPRLLTVGVDTPGTGPGGGPARQEVVLAAGTGRRLHAYPAAALGGAVAVAGGGVVIVGPRSVTSYDGDGDPRWSRPTGTVAQAWEVDGDALFVSVAAGGTLGTAPVRALRRISLGSGDQRLIRPRRKKFAGTLSMAFDGVVLFTDAAGVTAYSGGTGRKLWHRHGALPEGVDAADHRLYLRSGSTLVEVTPATGATDARVSGVTVAGSAGLYEARQGAVLGLDHGGQGQVWGYDVESKRVLWVSGALPWPHYFVDLSGIGGSAAADWDAVLLAVCARLGRAVSGGQSCARPELAAINR